MNATENTKPMRKDVARNRELLITTAQELLKTKGVSFTLNELAKAAGVGVGTVYRHFNTKDELLSILVEIPANTASTLLADLSSQEPSVEGLKTAIFKVCQSIVDNKAIGQLLLSPDLQQAHELQMSLFQTLDGVLDEVKKLPGVRQDVQATDFPFIFSYTAFLSTITHHEDPNLWKRYIGALVDGLLSDSTPLKPSPLSQSQVQAVLTREHQRIGRFIQE